MRCTGCSFSQFPECAIQSIVTATALENIMIGTNVKTTLYPVCHKNAQNIHENRLVKGASCDGCLFCDALCVNYESNEETSQALEKIVFSNLNRFNMYLKRRLAQCVVGTEIKAKGNAREKRIDVVIKRNSVLYMVKVLADNDKFPYYSRSYAELVSYYSANYDGVVFKSIIVMPNNKIESARAMGYECYSLDELVKEITEV